MNRIRPTILTPVVALALLAWACTPPGASTAGTAATSSGSASSGSAATELAGTSWVLVDLDGTAPAGARLTLAFRQDGNAGGNAGCNTYNGTFTVDGARLTFGPLISTKMACEQPLMTIESAYLAALQETTSYTVDGTGNLVLSGAATLTFSPA